MSNAVRTSRFLFRQMAVVLLATAPAFAETPAKPVFGVRLAADGRAMITIRDGKDQAVLMMNPSLSQINAYADCEHGNGAYLAVDAAGHTTRTGAMRPEEVVDICRFYRVPMGPQ